MTSYRILASLDGMSELENISFRMNEIRASVTQLGMGLQRMAQRNSASVTRRTTPKPSTPTPQRSPGAQSQHLYGQFDPSKHVRHQDGGYAPINRTGTAQTWGAGIRKSA